MQFVVMRFKDSKPVEPKLKEPLIAPAKEQENQDTTLRLTEEDVPEDQDATLHLATVHVSEDRDTTLRLTKEDVLEDQVATLRFAKKEIRNIKVD